MIFNHQKNKNAMKEINLKEIIHQRHPDFFQKPKYLVNLLLNLLDKITYMRDINSFIQKNPDLKKMQFIDEIFEFLNFSFKISNKDIKRIPAEGRLICVANHPIGSLDGLALLRAVGEIRDDVKIIANDILYSIENLHELLIPYNVDTTAMQRKSIELIGASLEKEEAIIIFPAAEVSRMKWFRVQDNKWNSGAVYFSKKYKAPVLPIFVDAKNSLFFYLISAINKNFSRVLLVHELFNKKNKTINIKIGDPIPAKAFVMNLINTKVQTKLLKKHVYGMQKNKAPIFITEKNIIHPINKKLIKKELNNSEMLGLTRDDKKIIITDANNSPNVLNEIARLREITFRKVGEGTGRKLDLDNFDKYYKHLVVWDESELEIVGSYRIGVGSEIYSERNSDGFYTSTLFRFLNNFDADYLPASIELGRSFVQKKYWNTNALFYLWQGIGAYIAHNPETKFMFGGVSISNNYPESAKRMIVYYFLKWFGSEQYLAEAKNKYRLSDAVISKYDEIFIGANYKEDYRTLKNMLKPSGYSVPILYKHYSELCDDNGVRFLDFGVDPDFENCIDGLILVDINKIRDDKRERYIDQFIPEQLTA